MISLGKFPKVSLADARKLRDTERDILDSGMDPAEERRFEKFKAAGAFTFKKIASQYLDDHANETKTAAETSRARFEKWVYPFVGGLAFDAVTRVDLLKIIRRIEADGKGETAKRVRADISRVYRWAIARCMIDADPTPIKEALKARKVVPYPNVTDPKKLAGILRAIDDYEGEKTTKLGLQLLPLLLCRPGELRTLRWSEVHEDEIRLDESRTKAGIVHLIPLSTQAKAILNELREITGHTEFCFPSTRSADRPMSDNTLNAALRRMGFTKEELVAHSFRKIASTALHELGFESMWIEKQLGHTDRNKIRAIYNHADYLNARRQMLQEWSDHLDSLKAD